MNCSSPIFPFQRITTSPNTEPSRPGRRPRVSSPALHIQSSASPRPACKTGPGAPWCHLRRCRLHHQLQRKPPPTLTLTRHMAPRYPPAPVRVSPGRFSTQQPQQAFKNMNDISEPPSPIPTCGMPSAFAAARATPRGPEAPTPPAWALPGSPDRFCIALPFLNPLPWCTARVSNTANVLPPRVFASAGGDPRMEALTALPGRLGLLTIPVSLESASSEMPCSTSSPVHLSLSDVFLVTHSLSFIFCLRVGAHTSVSSALREGPGCSQSSRSPQGTQ